MSSKTPLDEMLLALADIHRRRLLMALLEHTSQKADEVHIPEEIHTGQKEPERLHTLMFHIHLPRLENAGFIRWEKETDTVVKGPRFEEIRPLLELIHTHVDELPTNWL